MSGSASPSSSSTNIPLSPVGPLKLNSISIAQRRSILQLAARSVVAAVAGQPGPNAQESLAEFSQSIIMGAFVTLKRNKSLRGCCGVLGQPMQLGPAVARAAIRTAKEDTRMAAISPAELPYLNIDVTLLGPFKQMTVEPSERPSQIQIGKHGLMIQMGDKSGLLLPSVATENGWEQIQFLQAACRKANLPISAWEQAAGTAEHV